VNRFELIRRTLMWESVAAAARARASGIREQLTADARAEYAEQGTAPTWRLPDIGTVTLPVSKESVYVADETALTRWVDANAPSEIEIVYRIRPAYLTSLLGSVRCVDGLEEHMVADDEGTIIPGLAVRPGGDAASSLSFRPTPLAKQVAAAGAERLMESVEKAIGEPIVLEVPDGA
jgi:hypothetical protein